MAIAGATEAGLGYLIGPPTMSLAFALVSDGRYEEALQALQPLLAGFDAEHDTEIVAGAFLPDAVAALAAVGRTEDAEPLVRRWKPTVFATIGPGCSRSERGRRLC